MGKLTRTENVTIADHIRELEIGRDIHLNTREALRLLAARVEALEKRQQQAIEKLTDQIAWWGKADSPDPYSIGNAAIAILSTVRDSLLGWHFPEPAAEAERAWDSGFNDWWKSTNKERSTVELTQEAWMLGKLNGIAETKPAASGGPKREALPNPLDQWGDPPFPAEATPKPIPDLWSSCAPKPCTFCGEITTTSYNSTPMHRGCSRPAAPDAGTQEAKSWKMGEIATCVHCGNPTAMSCNGVPMHPHSCGKQPPPPATPERQERKACPCHHVTPCSQECTCVKPWSSRGCERCCSYGNPEQQKVRAVHLTQQPAQWRDAALLVDQWRARADTLDNHRTFPEARSLRECADQLAALLPPEKEAKS